MNRTALRLIGARRFMRGSKLSWVASFSATGITACLEAGGTLANAQAMAEQ
jgi:hypothetical protein